MTPKMPGEWWKCLPPTCGVMYEHVGPMDTPGNVSGDMNGRVEMTSQDPYGYVQRNITTGVPR